jgi:hypothetical protein
MTDIASLGIEIDSTSAVTAKSALDSVTEAGGRTEAQVKRLSNEDMAYQSVMKRTGETLEQVKARFEHTTRSIDSATQAVQQQAKAEEVAASALKNYKMSADEATAAIAALRGAQGSYNKETEQAIKVLQDMGGVVDETGAKVGSFSQRAKTDLMQMAQALMRGDFPMALRQLAQLATHSWAAVKGLAAMLAPALAVGAAFGVWIKHGVDIEKFNQSIGATGALLAGTGRAGIVSSGELSTYVETLKKVSNVSEEMAMKVVQSFAKQGAIGREMFGELTGMVPDFARAMGVDAAGAAEELAAALGKPLTGVIALDEKYNILTFDQYKQVQAMVEVGDAAGIQAIALEALHGRIDGLHNEGLTPLQKAWDDLLRAWRGTPEEGEKVNTMMDNLAHNVSLMADAVRTAKDWWAEFLKVIGDTAPIKAANAVLEISLRLRQALGLAADKDKVAADAAQAAHVAHAKLIAEQDAKAIAGQEAAILARQAKEKAMYAKRLQEAKKSADELRREQSKALADELKALEAFHAEQNKMRDLDDAGWVKYIEAQIKEYEDGLIAMGKMSKSAAEQRLIDEKEANKQSEKELRRHVQDQISLWAEVGNYIGTFLTAVIVDNENAVDMLKRMWKQFFAELIQLFATKMVLNLAANITGNGALSIAASAAGQGSTAGAVYEYASGAWSAYQGGSTAWGALTGTGATTAAGGQVTAATFGNVVGGGSSTAAAGATPMSGMAVAGIVAIVIAAMIANDAMYQRGWRADDQSGIADMPGGPLTGDRLLRSLGLGDRAASLLSGSSLHTRIWGRRATQADASGISGTVTGAGEIEGGRSWQDYSQAGGWFRSDRRWTESEELTADQAAPFTDALAQIHKQMVALGKLIGVDAAAILENYTHEFVLQLTSTSGQEEVDAAIAQFLNDVFVEQAALVLGEATGYIRSYIDKFRGTQAELIDGIVALVTIFEVVSRSPMEDVATMLYESSNQFQTALSNNDRAIRAQLEAYDGSLESTQALAQATVDYYNAQVQLLASIEQVRLAVTGMFDTVLQSIELSGMTAQQQYEFYQRQANDARDAALLSTDPAEIQRQAGIVTSSISSAWSLLSPEQQTALRTQFLEDGRAAQSAITTHLTDIQTTAATQMQSALDAIKEAITAGAATQTAAANTQLQAANTNANTTHRVDVGISVEDNRVNTTVVNDGG